MTLPRISLDPANPDSLYTGAQKINQVIEATENHIHATNNPHQVTADQIGAVTQAQIHDILLLFWMGVM